MLAGLERFLRLIFPDRCAGCRQLGALFCSTCWATLTPYPRNMDAPLPALDDIQIAFVFAGPLRSAVHQLKYRGGRRIAEPLGQLMAAHHQAHPCVVDGVIPIPLHTARLAERGFNQAEALAFEVTRTKQYPLVNKGLVRVRATGQQAKLTTRERHANMQAAFAWEAEPPPPERVLLVDDVLTTGATMNACAGALRQAGSKAVYGLALARSRPDR